MTLAHDTGQHVILQFLRFCDGQLCWAAEDGRLLGQRFFESFQRFSTFVTEEDEWEKDDGTNILVTLIHEPQTQAKLSAVA